MKDSCTGRTLQLAVAAALCASDCTKLLLALAASALLGAGWADWAPERRWAVLRSPSTGWLAGRAAACAAMVAAVSWR